MPITIEVLRAPGDRHGGEINEPLIGESRAAAIARGQAELDTSAQQTIATTLELIRPRLDLTLGALIRASDPTQGATWTGRIVGIQHDGSAGAVPTTITVERPVSQE